MNHPPTVKAVRIVGPLKVEIDWSTSETLRVDLRKLTATPRSACMM